MKSNKYGFTLAEVMVCLAIISVMATILLPTLKQFKPNKTKTMFKKSYQITERVIYELVNDNDIYPSGDKVKGFDNVMQVRYGGTTYGDSKNLTSADAKQKFCKLFAMKLNTAAAEPNCSVSASYTGESSPWVNNNKPSINTFTTSDGVVWFLPYTNFTNPDGDTDEYVWKVLWIDVNGDNAPNLPDSKSGTCSSEVDRFPIYIRNDGKVNVETACAREYMNDVNLVNSKTSGKSNADLGGTNITVKKNGSGHVSDDEDDSWFKTQTEEDDD